MTYTLTKKDKVPTLVCPRTNYKSHNIVLTENYKEDITNNYEINYEGMINLRQPTSRAAYYIEDSLEQYFECLSCEFRSKTIADFQGK